MVTTVEKKVKGRKRHLLVGTEGFVLKAKVRSAKVMDYEGIKKALLDRAKAQFPRLFSHLWLDAGGYSGEYVKAATTGCKKTLGWTVEIAKRAPKPAPEKVC